MSGESRHSPRKLKAFERQKAALELRIACYSYEQIKTALGYRTASAAYQAVEAALQKTLQEPADDLRKREIEKLNLMEQTLYNQIKNGHTGAIDRVIKIQERRAKLLGLDAPTKIAPTDPTGNNQYHHLSDEELLAKMEGLNAIIASNS